VHDEHVDAALDALAAAGGTPAPVPDGNVGGGTWMICHDFKGGIATASRRLPEESGGYTVGVLVQANHGLRRGLTIAGVPVGREITDLLPEIHPPAQTGSPGQDQLDHRGDRHGRTAAPAPARPSRPAQRARHRSGRWTGR
jgi:D-aminopeptidase